MYGLGMRLVEPCSSRKKLIHILSPPIPPTHSPPLPQAHQHILSGYYPCSEEDAIYLAGVSMQVQMAMTLPPFLSLSSSCFCLEFVHVLLVTSQILMESRGLLLDNETTISFA